MAQTLAHVPSNRNFAAMNTALSHCDQSRAAASRRTRRPHWHTGLLLLLSCCFALFGRAASASTINYVQSNCATLTSKSTVAVKYPSAQLAGDLNVVVVGWNDSTTTVKTVTDSAGNAYSLAVGPTVVSGLLTQSIYFARNIAQAGANTVTVTFSKSAYYPDIRILEYSGADLINPIDAVGANSGTSTSSSASAVTTNPTDLILGADMVRDMTNGPGAGFNQRLLTGFGDIAEDKMVGVAGSNSATAPISDASVWLMQIVALRTPSGGTPSPVTPTALACTNSSMTGSGTDACTVKLTAAAPSGGLTVSLASNNVAVAAPTSITVAAGAASGSFSATVSAVSTTQAATLTASANSVTQSLTLQLNAAVPTLSTSTSSLSFGSMAVNAVTTQSLTLSSTGTAPVTVNSATLTGPGFSISGTTFPLTLNPNQTAKLTVQFAPSAAGAAAGQLALSSNSSTGALTAISLSGTALPVLTALSCTNSSMIGAGTDACTISLNAAAATGGFTVGLASNNSSVTLPASVSVVGGATSASFSATASSISVSQTVTLTASAGGVSRSFALQLVSAAPTLSINATSVAFGAVSQNTPATQLVTLTSTGAAPVTVNSATTTGTGFSVSGATFPLTLNSNQTAVLSVEFDPTAAGAVSGQLIVSSNSSTNPSAVISLSGMGEATSYSVSVTWIAPLSSTDPVAGYNVYRSPSGGSTYQLLSSTNSTQLAYTDSNVQGGQTYNYIVESVDASGNESVPSNMASVTLQ